MLEALERLLDGSGFVPRWSCGRWSPALGWLHVVADLAVWGAYMAIPIALLVLVRRRRDVPFPRLFWLFGAFIFACGTVHLLEAITFWAPLYRLSGAVKVVTAVVSWATVIALVPVLPRAVALPGIDEMNQRLAREIEQRRAAFARLEQQAEELRRTNHELERFNRVAVGRELRMLEVKAEVNELLARCGEPPRYAHAATAGTPPGGQEPAT